MCHFGLSGHQFNAQPQDVSVPSPHFTVLVLLPLRVDHLQLPNRRTDPRRPAHFESVLQPNKAGVRLSTPSITPSPLL
jgi:hypothetical protein